MSKLGWRTFLLCYLTVAAAAHAAGGTVEHLSFHVASAATVAAILVGVRRHRPASRLPWYAFAAGIVTAVVADILPDLYAHTAHHLIPEQPVSDLLYVTSYVALAAGMLLLAGQRQQGGRLAAIVDALTVSVGAGVVVWTYFLDRYADSDAIPLGTKVDLLSRPLLDLLVVAVLIRLVVNRSTRNGTYLLLAASLGCLVLSDVLYLPAVVEGSYRHGGPVELARLASYALWGAAALHPGIADTRAIVERPGAVPRWRLVLFGVAAILAPAVAVAQELRGEHLDAMLLGIASSLVIVLVMVRLAHTMSFTVAAYRRMERGEARQRELAVASAALVGATTPDEVYASTVRGAWRIAGALTDSPAYVVRYEGGDDLAVLAAAPRSADPVDRLPAGLLNSTDTYAAPLVAGGGSRDARLVVGCVLDTETTASLDTLVAEAKLAVSSLEEVESRQRERGTRMFQALIRNSSDAITVLGPDLAVRYRSPAAATVLGVSDGETDADVVERIHPDDLPVVLAARAKVVEASAGAHEVIEYRIRHRDGTWRTVESALTNLLGEPDVDGIVVNSRDVTDRRTLEGELVRQALHDGLTDLPNRVLLTDRVGHALVRRREPGQAVAVLFVDLDDFKVVNDSLGHPAGDELLRQVATRLAGCARADDTVARLGGDEFAILVEDVGAADVAIGIAERLLAALQPGFEIAGEHLRIGASVGIAVADTEPVTPEELLRDADLAMYVAKRRGKNGYELFDPSMHQAALYRLQLTAELRKAIDGDQLVVHYQPIVDVHSGQVAGAEALVRWQHPSRGLLPPGDFIPLAEETGLVVELGRAVLARACLDVQGWRAAGRVHDDFYVSVNVSVRQLVLDSLVHDVAATLATTGLPASALVLEITETALMGNVETTAARTRDLRRLGVRVAVDDFGTGFSSLSYLGRLDVDILKIDKSFVDRVAVDAEGIALVQTVIDLGHALGLETVAEGIEERSQLSALDRLGCARGQGYYLARPMAADALVELLGELRDGALVAHADRAVELVRPA